MSVVYLYVPNPHLAYKEYGLHYINKLDITSTIKVSTNFFLFRKELISRTEMMKKNIFDDTFILKS